MTIIIFYNIIATWRLKYNICCSWILDIRISTCSNQACAGLRPARAWFLKIVSVRMCVCVFVCVCMCVCVCVCVCVCPPQRLLITSGMMWRDMDPI